MIAGIHINIGDDTDLNTHQTNICTNSQSLPQMR